MHTPITFDELNQMPGEVLPERTVLSTMLSACTTTTTYFEPGVTGLLALGMNKTPVTTVTCMPAAIGS